MRKDALAFALAGTLFGVIVGWTIGAQQAGPAVPAAPAASPASAQPSAAEGGAAPAAQGGRAPAVLDDVKVRALTSAAESRPKDAAVRVELANMYFDAERYADAIKWYEQAIALTPKDPNVSTDLGLSYYYSNDPDRAIAQFQRSLAVDPSHTKTWLNMGVVRAFGKQDLAGAAEAWQKVVEIAPNSPEGRAAKQALDALKSAHPNLGTGQGAPQGTTGSE